MPSMRYFECLAETLREEINPQRWQPVGGPYLRNRRVDNDPDDTGGITFMGILQREYNAWRDARGLERQSVGLISDDEVHEIYFEHYWRPMCCDRLPPGLDLTAFDFAVNCGVGAATKRLQRALGVAADGHIGVVSLEAAASRPVSPTVKMLTELRLQYHKGCRTAWKHLRGWTARTNRICGVAERMATAAASFAFASAANPSPIEPEPGMTPVEAIGDWQTEAAADPVPRARQREAQGPLSSKTIWTSMLGIFTTIMLFVEKIGELVGQAREALGTVREIGVLDVAGAATASPQAMISVVLCVAVIGLLAYIALERRGKFI